MTDYKTKRALKTFDEIVLNNGIPEDKIKISYLKDNKIHVHTTDARTYVKNIRDEAKGNV